jgi:RimJ/RimL family protein N-acetyltransferase
LATESIPYPDPPLTSDVVILRPFREADYAAALACAEDPSTARWVNTLPAADAAGMVRFVEQERRSGKMLDLAVADPSSDAYLGEILLFLREHRVAEMAYAVAPAARGHGVATAAVELLARWAFAELAIARIELRVEPGNEASERVAVKAGFVREGLLRSAFVVRGHRRDVNLYARLGPLTARPKERLGSGQPAR